MTAHGTPTMYNKKCRCDECVSAWVAYQATWREARLADPSTSHGNRVTYLCGCRCDECRAANASYNLARKTKVRGTDQPVPHGTLDGYGSFGCRCERCSTAKQSDTRRYYLVHQFEFLTKAARRSKFISNDRRAVTPRDIDRLLAKHGHRCAYCRSDDRVEIDHVIPISRGGRHAIGNLLPACITCNRSKNDRLLIEFRTNRRRPRVAA